MQLEDALYGGQASLPRIDRDRLAQRTRDALEDGLDDVMRAAPVPLIDV
jgi:hypothetical protein